MLPKSFIAFLLLPFFLTASPALAEKRVALIVGINDYTNLNHLQKARADADAFSALLARPEFGFKVSKLLDPDREKLRDAFAQFLVEAADADVALMHFSGHGVEVAGQNKLLAADFPDITTRQEQSAQLVLRSDGFDIDDLVAQIKEAGARSTVLIVDACRENPFKKSKSRSLVGSRGLGQIAPRDRTYIAYSAGAGELALDRLNDADREPTSVFMRYLLPELQVPGRTLDEAVKAARRTVNSVAREQASHNQTPAIYDQSLDPIYLNLAAAKAPPTPSYVPPPPVAISPDEMACRSLQDARTAEPFELYLRRFPNGMCRDFAEIQVSSFRPVPKPAVPAPAPSLPAPSGTAAGEYIEALGIQVSPLGDGTGAFKIDSITNRSPVLGSLFLGDVILKVNYADPEPGKTPRTVLENAILEKKRINLLVKRGNATESVSVRAR